VIGEVLRPERIDLRLVLSFVLTLRDANKLLSVTSLPAFQYPDLVYPLAGAIAELRTSFVLWDQRGGQKKRRR